MKLAKMEPGQMTPRSKHYGVKYHWFRTKLKPNEIEIQRVDTKLQKADFLTKALRVENLAADGKRLILRSRGSVMMLHIPIIELGPPRVD
jgi:hypothetical protein